MTQITTAISSTQSANAPLAPPAMDTVPPESVDLQQRQTLLALQHQLEPNEITYRRARLRGAQRFFGLDIHKDYALTFAVDADLGPVYGPVTVTWERFDAWINKTLTPTDAVVIEMTTNAWETHDHLLPHVHSVTIVHPPSVKLITAAPVMTDKKACEALAMLLAAGLLRPVWVPDAKHREWRQLVATRYDRVVETVQAQNRLHAILHRHQLQGPAGKKLFSASQRDWWLNLPLSPVEKLAVRQALDTLAFSQKHIAEIEAVMAQELLADERMPYLLQLPGIGVVGGMTILAALGPIDRFPDDRNVVGYAGLGGRVHISGKKSWTGAITKEGRIDLRATLISAAQIAKRTHPYWKQVFGRLAPRIGKPKAVVAIARQLLVSIWHILKKHEADQHADASVVAKSFLSLAYDSVGARHLPDGQTAPEFVRRNLDVLQIGKDLQRVKRSRHEILLPPSTQPGAAPAALPKGRGQVQNTKAAQAERQKAAAAKRQALAAQREAAAKGEGKPRKPRSDKGVKRGPRAKT